MNSRRFYFILAIFIVGGVVWMLDHRRSRIDSSHEFQHVFVNETSDTRFDESIEASILAAFSRGRVQNAVILTDRYSGQDFEKAAAELFTRLNLGRENGGRAILYLYSPRAQSLKIEVGYALEGVLPDAEVKGYEMAAKSFIYSDRLQDFWAELINTLNIEIYDREHGQTNTSTPFDYGKLRYTSGGAGVISNLYSTTNDQLKSELRRMERREQNDARYAPSFQIEESVTRYLSSLHDGVGDPNLPILSPESQIFRELTPMTTYQLFRNWRMYERAGHERILVSDDMGFVFFAPDHPVLPIVLSRAGGFWRVEEPMSWSLFQRFEDSMRVFLKYPLKVSSRELQQFLDTSFGRPLNAGPVVSASALLKIDVSTEPLRYFYFRLFWLERVVKELELLPTNQRNRVNLTLALDSFNNLGQISRAQKILDQLIQLDPDNLALVRARAFYLKTYQFNGPSWRHVL